MADSTKILSTLESLESHQPNLGLYTTHITARCLHTPSLREGVARPLDGLEAALQYLMARGEVIRSSVAS